VGGTRQGPVGHGKREGMELTRFFFGRGRRVRHDPTGGGGEVSVRDGPIEGKGRGVMAIFILGARGSRARTIRARN
jgi:hypothetical protein